MDTRTDTHDKHGYSQTFVDAAIQIPLFIGDFSVQRIYAFADVMGKSRSEVLTEWVCDMADEICDIWRKHLEEQTGDFLGALCDYTAMLCEILESPETKELPDAPSWEDFQKWIEKKGLTFRYSVG